MAPATAENAKPDSPETKAPANTATLSRRLVAMSGTMRSTGSIVRRLWYRDLGAAGAEHGIAPIHLRRRDRLRMRPFQHRKPYQLKRDERRGQGDRDDVDVTHVRTWAGRRSAHAQQIGGHFLKYPLRC